MKWAKLILASVAGLSLWGGVTTANAAKKVTLPAYPKQRVFTFKAKGTKVYSYPRAAYKHSSVLGTDQSTTKQWTVDKVITVKGQRYVRLARVSAKSLPHGTIVPNASKANVKLVGGYVALNKLKFHQQIASMKSVKKTAYWTPTTKHDLWNMPAHSLGKTAANHYGHTYGYRTLYAVESLTTTSKKSYLYFETADGKAIGWLPKNAVIKGQYPDLLKRELGRNLSADSTALTTVDKAGHVKVGVALKAGQVQRVALLKQNSETAVYDFTAGKAVKLTTRTSTGKVKQTTAVTQTTKNLKFKAQSDFDIQGYTYNVKVTPAGKVSVLSVGGWMA
jgi:hypothetical protein